MSYSTTHLRLRRQRGPAAEFACADCAGPANEWSYDGLDPDHKIEDGMAYSLNLDHYAPRCFMCHSAFDRPKQDVCECGTTYQRDNKGWARCPTCRLAGRAARGEMKRPGVGRAGDRTHCPLSHPYDDENTYLVTRPDGSIKQRMCRKCMADRQRARRAAMKGR